MAVNQIGFAQYNPNSLADFTPLAKLGEVYREAQNRDKLSALGKQLASGSSDYRSAAGQTADMGDIGSTLKFIALAEQQRKEQAGLASAANFAKSLSGLVTGDTPSAAKTIAPVAALPDPAADDEPPPRPMTPPPPMNAPIRTNPDGTIAGNITAPTEPPPIMAAPLPRARPAAAPPAPLTPTGAPVMPPVATAEAPPGAFDSRFAGAQAQAPAGPPPMTEGPTVAHIPMLLSAISDPNLPEAQKEIAKDLWKRAWDSAKPTEKIQTLQGLRDNPELLAIEKDLRKSQATTVNMMPGEKKQDEELGKTLGEIHANYIKDAFKAQANKANLDAAERAMSQPGFVSGTLTPAITAARRALVGMGIADEKDIAPNELFAKLQNKAIMDAGGSSSGLGPQISNNDAKIIRDSTFNQTNTVAGNKLIIGFQRLLEDRKVDYAKEMNRYAKAHGGRLDLDAAEHMSNWAEANPLDYSKVPGFAMPAPPAPDPLEAEMRKRKLLK